MTKIAVIYYSTYGHVLELAKEEIKGIKEAGASVDIYQIPETLPNDVLQQMHAPPKPSDIPIATVDILTKYDGFLFGFSTRFGSFPAQFKSFWDATGGLWAQGSLHGKYVGVFLSTASLNGGQETLTRNVISNFVHHGLIYVPLGAKEAGAHLSNFDEVHGGSAWGAGTLAGGDGSRQPSKLEKEVAYIQGKSFAKVVINATTPKSSLPPSSTASTAAVSQNSKAAATATTAAAATTKPETSRTKQQTTSPETKASTTPEKKKKFGCCLIM